MIAHIDQAPLELKLKADNLLRALFGMPQITPPANDRQRKLLEKMLGPAVPNSVVEAKMPITKTLKAKNGGRLMYELGALIAAILVCISLAANLAASWSALGFNLALIGLRISIFTGQPVPMGSRSVLGRVFRAALWLLSLVLSAVLSWATVAGVIGMFLYNKNKDAGAPQPVKELRWRMRNVYMTKEQIEQEVSLASETTLSQRL